MMVPCLRGVCVCVCVCVCAGDGSHSGSRELEEYWVLEEDIGYFIRGARSMCGPQILSRTGPKCMRRLNWKP